MIKPMAISVIDPMSSSAMVSGSMWKTMVKSVVIIMPIVSESVVSPAIAVITVAVEISMTRVVSVSEVVSMAEVVSMSEMISWGSMFSWKMVFFIVTMHHTVGSLVGCHFGWDIINVLW
jgi:hypothetical protein